VTIGEIAAPQSAGEPAAAVLDRQPCICVLALSPIADDPRVRRQADAFHRAGWRVMAVGLPGTHSPDPEWRIVTRDEKRPCGGSETAPSGIARAVTDQIA
jgi:hypothetical protein